MSISPVVSAPIPDTHVALTRSMRHLVDHLPYHRSTHVGELRFQEPVLLANQVAGPPNGLACLRVNKFHRDSHPRDLVAAEHRVFPHIDGGDKDRLIPQSSLITLQSSGSEKFSSRSFAR